MALSIAQAFAISLLSFALWRVLRPFVVRTPLSNIPGPPSISWWKGNFGQLFDRLHGWEFHRELAEKYGGAVKLNMLFGDEQLYVSDPLALHHIVVKDQYVYEETDMFVISNELLLGKSLLSTLGDHHKKQRKILNPVFSLKHMRDLLPIFYPIAHQLRDILSREVHSGKETINVMMWMSRAALEYVGQGGLGYTFDTLDDKKSNNYSDTMKSPLNAKLFLHRQFLPYAVKIGSPAFRRKVMELAPFDIIKTITSISDTMYNCARGILRQKMLVLEDEAETIVNDQVGKGKDILSVLCEFLYNPLFEDRIPESELLGHMGAFIFAGHDTTTSALSRVLHQLVLYPEIQSKLREEVTAARKKYGDLEYDALMTLSYLDAVCRETLRVFPPVPQLNRTTRKDIVLPLLWPIKSADGKTEIKEIPLKKNTNVVISVLGANRSKRIWGEDAEEWKPERWLKPLPDSVSKAHLPGIYASMMTFLGGGRACIGFKFAEMEMKLVLSILLESFIFEPGPDIFWAMNFLQSPVLKDSDKVVPQLPLKVKLVDR
ncbi:cytochrome P450 [Phellopilus nigrolimitatus]|nr:cytochrome P450 [Phellopilus nigrolimitatus]